MESLVLSLTSFLVTLLICIFVLAPVTVQVYYSHPILVQRGTMITQEQAAEIMRRSQEEVMRGNYHHVTIPGGVSMMPRNLDEIIRGVLGEPEPLAQAETEATEDTMVF